MNLKACRRLFDSRLMRQTGKLLVVGRLTPFSSLMRLDKNRQQGEENSFIFYLFFAFKPCWSPKCAMTLAAALKFNRFEWTKWKFSGAQVFKTIKIRLLLKVCGVFFFSVVALFVDIWLILKYNRKGTS